MTCSSRTRRPPTSSTARGTAWPAPTSEPTAAEQAGVVVAYDVKTGKLQADLRHGPAQPREQRRAPGVRRSRRPLGRRHVQRRPALAALPRTSRRAPPRSGGRRAALRLSCPTVRASTTTTTSPSADGSVSGSSCRSSRRRSPRATQTRARELRPNANDVFQFVRVEDIAYDTRPAWGTSLTRATRGRGAATERQTDVRYDRPLAERSDLKLELDTKDPTIVTSLSILVDAERVTTSRPATALGEIAPARQPRDDRAGACW